MKNLLPAVGLGLSVLASRPVQQLHSHLLVEPHKHFVLGGNQLAGFRVAGQNVGPVPVEVLERPRRGPQVSRGCLAPGQRTVLRFAEGSAAVICNATTRQAVLDLDVAKYSAELTMTYEPAANK